MNRATPWLEFENQFLSLTLQSPTSILFFCEKHMERNDGFYFNPKRWLGDAIVMAMDWDCRAMHLHLMAIAWQQEPRGFLLNDDSIIRKMLGNPEENDWKIRIRPQIMKAWKTKNIKKNGESASYMYQPGILKTIKDAPSIRQGKKSKIEIPDLGIQGFNLKKLLAVKPKSTFLYVKPNESDKRTIWQLGVAVLSDSSNESKSRAMLAKLIKEYGEKPVAEAIAQLSIKSVPPADASSYLIGILQKNAEGKKGTGKGRVSI